MAWKNIPEKKVLATLKDGKNFKGAAAEKMTIYVDGAVPGGDGDVQGISVTVDPSTYVMTTQLKDGKGGNVGDPATVDLPLESMVVSGEYDDATKSVILTLKNGETVSFSVADLVAGLQSEITPQNPLSADLVAETANKNFVTSEEKEDISSISGLADNVETLNTNVEGLQSGVSGLNDDVNNLAGDVSTLQGDLNSKQDVIDGNNPLNADYIDDGSSERKLVTPEEKDALNSIISNDPSRLARFEDNGDDNVIALVDDAGNSLQFVANRFSQYGEVSGVVVNNNNWSYLFQNGAGSPINLFAGDDRATYLSGLPCGLYQFDADSMTLYVTDDKSQEITQDGTLIAGSEFDSKRTFTFIPADGSPAINYIFDVNTGEVKEKSMGQGNVGRYLTSDDYNWNSQTKTATEPYNAVALWLMEPGVYLNTPNNTDLSVFITKDNSVTNGGTFFVMNRGSNGTENELATILYVNGLNPAIRAVNVQKSDGFSYFGTRTLITSEDVVNSLDSTSGTTPLSANQGRVLDEKIGDLSSLETTDKSSLVNAINEVAEGGSGGNSDFTLLTDADVNWTDPDSGDEMIALWLLPTGAYKFSPDATVSAVLALDTDGESTWIDTTIEKEAEPIFLIQNGDLSTGGMAYTTVIYGGGGGVWCADNTNGLKSEEDSGSFLPAIYGSGTYTEPGLVPGYRNESDEFMYLGKDGWCPWRNANWTENDRNSPNYIFNKPTIPSKVSDLTNDAGYQDASQVSSAIASAVGQITSFEYEVVQTLPATGEAGKIYLVANSGTTPNIYDEYIWVNNAFEKIGTTEMDLSNYYTKTQTDTLLGGKADQSTTYTKTEVDTALGNKANSSDVYTKTQVDTALGNKANSSDVYSKSEVNTALAGKQDTIDANHKLDADLIDNSTSDNKTYETGTGAPTTSTEGSVGEMYVDKSTGTVYVCTGNTGGTYTWEPVSGGSGPTVVQTTGQSTTSVMSQKAVTDAIDAVDGVSITMTYTDPGEGSSLQANHFIAVYEI